MQSPIILHDDELKQIWLGMAKEMTLDDKTADEFYVRSGNRFIIDQIMSELAVFEPQLVFFEHSYFATTLDKNGYTVFVCVWKKDQLTPIDLNRFQSFFAKIDEFETKYPILWHPNFFISPESYSFYISASDHEKPDPDIDLTSFVSNEYHGQQHMFKVLKEPNEVFVGSFPFEVFLEEYVKEIIHRNSTDISLNIINDNTHRLRAIYDSIFEKPKNCHSYKLAIPILGSPVNKDSLYVGQGSIWTYIITERPIMPKLLTTLARKLAGYFKDISINYIFQAGLGLAKKAENQARKAAISQVLGRNMSHNHGSHVLSRMIHVDQINDLFINQEAVRHILAAKVKKYAALPGAQEMNWIIDASEIESINQDEQENALLNNLDEANEIAKTVQYLSPNKLNYSVGIYDKVGYFNSYMKSRMDFIADIATGVPTLESSKLFYAELISGIDKNRILLDRISGIDNFKYTIILSDCRNQINGDILVNNCGEEVSIEKDLAVAVPHDIVGQHALYTIIENIIRNTAKHSEKKDKELVNFHLEIREPDPEASRILTDLKRYYEVHIYDDVHIEREVTDLSDNEQAFFAIEGVLPMAVAGDGQTASLDKLEKLVYRQNIFINRSLLTSENTLRQSAWGIIEMEAAAAYLRKVPIELIDDKEFDLDVKDVTGKSYNLGNNPTRQVNVLKAFIKESKSGRHLAYRFFMLKPKEILLVIDEGLLVRLKNNNKNISILYSELLNLGIQMILHATRSTDGLECFVMNHVYEHEILVDATELSIRQNIGVLPERIVRFSFDEILALLDSNSIGQFKADVWRRYAADFIGNIKDYKASYRFQPERNPAFSAVFDHHGTQWKAWFKQFPATHQFIEIISGTSLMAKILGNASASIKANEKWSTNVSRDFVTYYKLSDSIYHQVVILDERIQEASETLTYKPENGGEIPFKEIYLATGVLVPEKKMIDLSSQSYDARIAAKIISYLESLKNKATSFNLKRGSKSIKFLVIHLGVLEKILHAQGRRRSNISEEQGEILQLINDFTKVFEDLSVKPIVISGRGLPPNVPRTVAFVNFSAVAQHCIDSRNKFLLSELLYAARTLNP